MKAAQGENWIAAKFGAHPDEFWGILDTGATLVSIPEPGAKLLVEAGEAHWTGEVTQMTNADGNTSQSRIFVIHRLTIGFRTLTDVQASTAPAGAPFLLGMSALGRLGPMQIDVAKGTVVFG
jgi:predicted aspartyl protease